MTTDQQVPTNGHLRDRLQPHARRRLGRRHPVGPVASFEPGRVATPRPRNAGWLLGGILLVILSAVGGVLLFSSRDQHRDTLVAARDLAAGEVLERADLRIERVTVEGTVGTVEASAVDDLVGQRTVGPVPQGALVHPGMFSSEPGLGPDEMDIGAALDPGEFPQSDLQIGSRVELLASAGEVTAGPPTGIGDAAGDADPAPPPRRAASIGSGTVTRVEERATGQLLVTLRVTRDVGLVAAQANRDDTLRIAVVGASS